jgi:hypothetical protein
VGPLWATQVNTAVTTVNDAVTAIEDLGSGTRGATRTIYVRTTGSDTNNGSTAGTAFREIRAAVASLDKYGPVLRGSIVIDVGAGTYKGGIKFPAIRGAAWDDFVKIVGPSVGGHPNVPTAIISKTADATATYGVQALDGQTIWLEDLKFTGAFAYAVDTRRFVYAQVRNCHGVGAGAGTVFFGALTSCTYQVTGGIVDGYENGFQEHFNVNRSFDTATSTATGTVVKNCDVGVQAKEDCNGHVDYMSFEDCGTGIELQAWSTANIKGATFKRNDVGIALLNSEIHNEATAVVWGTGADANTRRIYSAGMSAELELFGWADSTSALTSNVGHRPLVVIASSYSDVTVTGTTAETAIYNFSSLLRGGWYTSAGKRFRVVLRGSVVSAPTLAAGYRVLLRVAGTLAVETRIPSTAVVGDDFEVEFEGVCTADGNNQKFFGKISGYTPSTSGYAPRTLDLSVASGVQVSAIPGASGESVTFRSVEVYG